MSKGNANKRAGTGEERRVLKLLVAHDPDGEWESRTTDIHGERRSCGHALTHGFDVWSVKRAAYLEVKLRKRHITQAQISKWAEQVMAQTAVNGSVHIAYRQKRGDAWVAEVYPSLNTWDTEPFSHWVNRQVIEAAEHERWEISEKSNAQPSP